jgi:hypothetical protein
VLRDGYEPTLAYFIGLYILQPHLDTLILLLWWYIHAMPPLQAVVYGEEMLDTDEIVTLPECASS